MKLHRIGADGNKSDVYGWTPLALAKLLQKTDVVRYLNQKTAWGGTLPNAWMPYAAIKECFNVSENGLKIIHKSGLQCSISTNRPLPAGLDRYFFEVTSRKLADDREQPDHPIMAIGFCTFGAQHYQFPGWEPKRNILSGQSWGYHGDDGLFAGVSAFYQLSGEPYGSSDTIGCGVDLNARR